MLKLMNKDIICLIMCPIECYTFIQFLRNNFFSIEYRITSTASNCPLLAIGLSLTSRFHQTIKHRVYYNAWCMLIISQDIEVPTLDNVRSAAMLGYKVQNWNHVICVGPTGTGKTVTITAKLSHGLHKKYICEFIVFSARTSSNQTQVISFWVYSC